jgi:hypothetical protein
VTANYAQDTNTVTLSLPGMFSMPLEGSAANWHRFFLGLPSNYMSPDPAMRWPTSPPGITGYVQRMMHSGTYGSAYGYAMANPMKFTDPTGLAPTCHTPKDCQESWNINNDICLEDIPPGPVQEACLAAAFALYVACIATSD